VAILALDAQLFPSVICASSVTRALLRGQQLQHAPIAPYTVLDAPPMGLTFVILATAMLVMESTHLRRAVHVRMVVHLATALGRGTVTLVLKGRD